MHSENNALQKTKEVHSMIQIQRLRQVFRGVAVRFGN